MTVANNMNVFSIFFLPKKTNTHRERCLKDSNILTLSKYKSYIHADYIRVLYL